MVLNSKRKKNRKLKHLERDKLEQEKHRLLYDEKILMKQRDRIDRTIQYQEDLLKNPSIIYSTASTNKLSRLRKNLKDLQIQLNLKHMELDLLDRLLTLVRLRDDRSRSKIWDILSDLKISDLEKHFHEYENSLLDHEDLIHYFHSQFDLVDIYSNQSVPSEKTNNKAQSSEISNYGSPDLVTPSQGSTENGKLISLSVPMEQTYITIKPVGTDYLEFDIRRKTTPVIKKSKRIKFGKIEIEDLKALIPDPTENPDIEDIRILRQSISELIPKPIIEEYQKIHPDQSLILDVDESLIEIPWEFIQSEMDQDKSCMLLNHGVGRVVHSEFFENRTVEYQPESEFRFLIVCDPDCTLPAVRAEITILKNDFFNQENIKNKTSYSFLEGPVTINEFKHELKTGKYNFVYFSGHSRYEDTNSEYSYLKFIDGRFYSYELKRLFIKYGAPQIFFANSCMSANEEQWNSSNYYEQVFGLASSFLPYGVTYIGTLWAVKVGYAMVTMVEFFTHVINGVSFGESLRKARFRVFTDHGNETADWAAFLLYGNPAISINWNYTNLHDNFLPPINSEGDSDERKE